MLSRGVHNGADIFELYFSFNSMHKNQGPGCIDDIFTSQMDDGQNGLHLQDINGRDPISHFLDSVLIHSDAPNCNEAGNQGAVMIESDSWKNTSIKESGSCSGSDVEVAPQLVGKTFSYLYSFIDILHR